MSSGDGVEVRAEKRNPSTPKSKSPEKKPLGRTRRRQHSELKLKYEIARQRLTIVIAFALIIFCIALITMGGALYAFLARGEGFLSGYQLVMFFLILVGALVIFLAYIFDRLVTLNAEDNEAKKKMGVSIGGSVSSSSDKE